MEFRHEIYNHATADDMSRKILVVATAGGRTNAGEQMPNTEKVIYL